MPAAYWSDHAALQAPFQTRPVAVQNIISMLGAGACVHGNPLKRGLVSSPDPWPWSSFRVYHLNDSSVLSTDRLV